MFIIDAQLSPKIVNLKSKFPLIIELLQSNNLVELAY
jgi:hypothetical protein